MSQAENEPDASTVAMLETVEHELAGVINTLAGIEAIAKAWREAETTRPNLLFDRFIFRTVYDGLWDALIVGLGRIWDTDPRSASLPNLADVIKGTRGAKRAREHARVGLHPEREQLRVRRHEVVAHRTHLLPDTFDRAHAVDTNTARNDIAHIMDCLRKINEHLGRPPMVWGHFVDEAREDARESLARWRRGDPERPAGAFEVTP